MNIENIFWFEFFFFYDKSFIQTKSKTNKHIITFIVQQMKIIENIIFREIANNNPRASLFMKCFPNFLNTRFKTIIPIIRVC